MKALDEWLNTWLLCWCCLLTHHSNEPVDLFFFPIKVQAVMASLPLVQMSKLCLLIHMLGMDIAKPNDFSPLSKVGHSCSTMAIKGSIDNYFCLKIYYMYKWTKFYQIQLHMEICHVFFVPKRVEPLYIVPPHFHSYYNCSK